MLISYNFFLAWEDDDETDSKLKYKGKEPTFEYKPTSSHYGNANTGSAATNKNHYTNTYNVSNSNNNAYPINATSATTSQMNINISTHDYENSILNNVLKSSGISVKPTDVQLNEFMRKVKSLDQVVMFDLLKERYEQCLTNSDTKTLTVCYIYVYNYFIEIIICD